MRIRRRPARHSQSFRIALVATGLVVLLECARGFAQAQPQPPARPDASSNQPHDVYLEVALNGERSTLIAQFRELNGRLSARGRDLDNIGLATGRLGIGESAEVPLDSAVEVEAMFAIG